MDNKKIGKTIANLRKSQNLTQGQLAEKIYVSDKAISKWETGEGVPDISNLLELSKTFGVSMDYIIHGEGAQGVAVKPTETKNVAPNQTTEGTEQVTKPQKRNIDELVAQVDKELGLEKTQTVQPQIVQTQPQQSTTNIPANIIISYALAGASAVASFILTGFVGLIIAIIGMVIAKTDKPEFAKQAKLARVLNLIAMIVSIIMIVVMVLLIVFAVSTYNNASSGFWDLYNSVPNGLM